MLAYKVLWGHWLRDSGEVIMSGQTFEDAAMAPIYGARTGQLEIIRSGDPPPVEPEPEPPETGEPDEPVQPMTSHDAPPRGRRR